MTPEGLVKAKLKAWLKQYGFYYFMPVQTGMGAPGLDFYCCSQGIFYAFETKRPGGKLTARQLITAKDIKKAGGYVCMVTLDDKGKLAFTEL